MQSSEQTIEVDLPALRAEFLLLLETHVAAAPSGLRRAFELAAGETFSELAGDAAGAASLLAALVDELALELSLHADGADAEAMANALYQLVESRLSPGAAAA